MPTTNNERPGYMAILVLLVFLCVSGLIKGQTVDNESDDDSSYCAFADNKVSTENENGELTAENIERARIAGMLARGDGQTNMTMKCLKKKEFCYTFWFIDPVNSSKISIIMQGCWDHPEGEDCSSECIARTPVSHKNVRNNTRFCCCLGNMCNSNVVDAVNFTAADILLAQKKPVQQYVDRNYINRTIIISLASVIGCAVVIVAVFTVMRCWFSHAGMTDDPESSAFLVGGSGASGAGSSDGGGGPYQIDIDDLKIDSVISKGRYGEVYRALLNDNAVAVKMLCPAHRQYYYNERDVFLLPHMQHQSIVEFYGCKERAAGPEGPAQYVIVTMYTPLGTLSHFLKNNAVDWVTLCRMTQSIINGIAHLHTEITDRDKIKPTIAHRDINSRNILVRDDLSCCICDFGFAMKIVSTRLINQAASSAADDLEEHSSLADVGTLRYMAPEVLEGSVNLYDCKSSLTQVDIYAFGLVFWEIGMRCSDLYQGLPTPEYHLPFEAEVGLHPSFEDMQVLVSRNKKRPVFPDTWKITNPAIRTMKDTIEECWDQDAEARISAVCVVERTKEIAILWENRHKHVTPTSNYAHLKELEEKTDVRHNLMSSCSDFTSGSSEVPIDSIRPSHDALSRASVADENSLSTATVETTMSPFELTPSAAPPGVPVKVDCNIVFAQTSAPLRELRGLNPTAARNTHKDSDEELAIDGNVLVNKQTLLMNEQKNNGALSSGFNTLPMAANGSSRSNQAVSILPLALSSSSSSAAVPTRPTHRMIAYTQNHVDSAENQTQSEPTIVRPKKQNIPSNGKVSHLILKPAPSAAQDVAKISRLGGHLRKIGGKLALPYFSWKGAKTAGDQNKICGGEDVSQPVAIPPPVSSEVFLVNGSTVVRPKSLPLTIKSSTGQLPNQRPAVTTTALSNGVNHPLPLKDVRLNYDVNPVVRNQREKPRGWMENKQPLSMMDSGVSMAMVESSLVGGADGYDTDSGSGHVKESGMAGSDDGVASRTDSDAQTPPGSSHMDSYNYIASTATIENMSMVDNFGFEASCSPLSNVQETCVV